jgi:hypothetical protein
MKDNNMIVNDCSACGTTAGWKAAPWGWRFFYGKGNARADNGKQRGAPAFFDNTLRGQVPPDFYKRLTNAWE